MVGKYAALAALIRAFRDIRICSAERMSGRRSSNEDGKPGGTLGNTSCCVNERPRRIGPGLLPISRLIRFSVCSIDSSVAGIVSDAWYTNCSPWRTSNIVATPPCSLVLISRRLSSLVDSVRLAMSSSPSSSSRLKYAVATSLTTVVIAALRSSSDARNSARAAFFRWRNRPQMSNSKLSRFNSTSPVVNVNPLWPSPATPAMAS